MKAATPQEIEQVLRDMPEWRKQRLTEVLLAIARDLGFLNSDPQAKADTAGHAKPSEIEETMKAGKKSAKK